MTKRQTRKYEMLVRVQTFGKNHSAQFAEGSEVAKAFAAVNDAVAQVNAFGLTKLTARRESMNARFAAKQALAAWIAALARSARVMAKAVPGADAKFPLPTRRTDVAVLQSGRLLLQEATPLKDTFISCGLPATFVEDLQQAVHRFRTRDCRPQRWQSRGSRVAARHQRGIEKGPGHRALARCSRAERARRRRQCDEGVEARSPRRVLRTNRRCGRAVGDRHVVANVARRPPDRAGRTAGHATCGRAHG
jgi:hypothetical protein